MPSVYARLQTFVAGMSQAVEPELLQPGQYALGVNTTVRNGFVHTRPPFIDTDYTIATGKFQGAATYRLDDADRIVFGIGGNVYVLNLSTGTITNHGALLSATADTFYFCQAERYFIVQDGDKSTSWANAKWPAILYKDTLYTGQDAVRAGAEPWKALPKGGPMAYGHGKLFVATDYVYNSGTWTDQGRVGFMAGDPYITSNPANILDFEQTWDLYGGGRYGLPEELGFIYAMDFQHNVVESTGQGPLIIMAERGASSFMVSAPRNQWFDDSNNQNKIDFSVVQFRDIGTLSPNSLVHNNSDIYFRAKDGLRTLQQSAQSSQGSGIQNLPISSDVKDLMDLDTYASMPKISGAKVNNRMFWTTNPDTNGFKSLLCFDVNPIASITQQSPPIYDGIWTGFEFLGILTAEQSGEDHLFAFIRTQGGLNGLYRLDEDEYLDNEVTRPQSRLYTPSLYFKDPDGIDLPLILKKLQNVEVWLREVKGQVDFTVYFRVDAYPYWTQLSSGTVNSDPTKGRMKYNKLVMEVPDVDSEPHFSDRLDAGYSMQLCIQWTGTAKISMIQSEANTINDKAEVASSLTGTEDDCEVTTNLNDLDDYAYRVV